MSAEWRMYKRGVVVWHTSDPEGGGPDVGISVGTGDKMIYAGEAQGSRCWGMYIYLQQGERIVISHDVDTEQAREFIEWLSLNLKDAPND